MKDKLTKTAKLSVYKTTFVLILTNMQKNTLCKC